MLTQDRLKELLSYDPKTGNFIWLKQIYNGVGVGDIAGSITLDGYRAIGIDSKIHQAHRLVWLYCYGYMPEYGIDHIDRNPLNNRIENLREVSNQCNQRNTGNWNTNKSGVKGVCWVMRENKWHAQIVVMGKQKNLGYYKDFNEAVLARLAAEQCLDWSNCDSNSPAYQYAINNGLVKK